jgi:hypothetical protein
VDIHAHLSLPVVTRRPPELAQRDEPAGAVADPAATYRAPAIPPGLSNGDDQVYAAAELVRLGLAARVTLVNATVDDALPDSWEIRGTPVGLVRLPAGRSRLIAGPR